MNEEQISRIVKDLKEYFDEVGPENFDLDTTIENYKHPITSERIPNENRKEIRKQLLDRINYRESHDDAVLIPISVVSDPKEFEEWYEDWLEKNDNSQGSYYWKRLEHYLSNELTRKYGPSNAGRIVKSIDDATNGIMKKLANPKRPEFDFKGLVLGYVQSGKTANFTALITKAVDAGYKFIVVLAGIHNILRRQTQIRLDKELTGMNDINLDENFIDRPSAVKKWERLTSARLENDGEFSPNNLDPFSSYCEQPNPTIAIIKKNCSVLDKLIEYIEDSSNFEDRDNMPVLVIDDEADQASIDTNANNPDTDPTRTNDLIRSLMTLFSRKSYVGYTATPFANVLIDLSRTDAERGDDLYPRNFIVSLPKPEGYFGAADIFESHLSDQFVRVIPDERNSLSLDEHLTDNLMNAVNEFLLSCAVRNIRGDKDEPMSMLVHISHKIDDMNAVYRLVEGYFRENILVRFNDTHGRQSLFNELEELWSDMGERSNVINSNLDLDNKIPDFTEIWDEIENVFQTIQVIVLNSDSDDELDYNSEEEIKVIAVGGNQLSRGLTLEGLMTSYYLRPSRQYDTLLQMGRWFGYRQGYQDLTRIYTTADIWGRFEHLALVEEEIRRDISRYDEEGKTPAELALSIRDHRTLNVTAGNKMGAAQAQQVSYSRSTNQTFRFPLDQPSKLENNLYLADSFIREIDENFSFALQPQSGSYITPHNIPGELILRNFLSKYEFEERNEFGGSGIDREELFNYLRRRMEHDPAELQNWAVAVVGNAKATSEGDPIELGGLEINRIQRSRLRRERGYNVGVLTDPKHLKMDLIDEAENPFDERSPQEPLLIIYPVWSGSRAASVPEGRESHRVDLFEGIVNEGIDVIGFAIVLPQSNYEPYNYIGQ